MKADISDKSKLYKWQAECLDAWEAAGCRGIVNAVTGSGKTRLAIAAAARLTAQYPDLRIKIVAPTIALANQWRQNIIRSPEFSGERTGFYGGGVRDDAGFRIMIYVINSARKGLQKHVRADFALGRHVLLICDECHRYKSAHNRRIFSFMDNFEESKRGENVDISINGENRGSDRAVMPAEKNPAAGRRSIDIKPLYHSLGLSATPFNDDNDELLINALGPEIYKYDFRRASQDETITRYYVCQVAAGFMGEEAAEYRRLSDAVRKAYGQLVIEYPYLKLLKKDAFLKETSRLARESEMDPEDPAAAFLMLTYQRKEVSVLAEARIRCCAELVDRLLRHDRMKARSGASGSSHSHTDTSGASGTGSSNGRSRIIIFSERISQAEKIYSIISRRHGSIAGLYHSGMTGEARERVLDDYRNNRIRILVSCKCLDEGIDVPDASVGIVVSSSAVPRQRIQRLGRIVRNSEGKEAASLYYIFIRESMDDRAYLSINDGEVSNIFDLIYYSSENVFANDMYEYAAMKLLEKEEEKAYAIAAASDTTTEAASDDSTAAAASETEPDTSFKAQNARISELRKCILEGLCMPDYLLDDKILARHIKTAKTTHEKNYYTVMRRIHRSFTAVEENREL